MPVITFGWYAFVEQIVLGRPFGDNPGPDWMIWLMWISMALLLPLLMFVIRLIVSVDDEEIVIHWYPFWTRRVRTDQMEQVGPCRYRPIREYGGWGIRYGGKERGWAYTMRGVDGVFLVLKDGKRVLIGSQDATRLVQAIQAGPTAPAS